MITQNATTKIINHSILTDETTLNSIITQKNASEYIEMLLRFEDGDGIAHKDYVLEMQNTTRENYPSLLIAFIADINKSTTLILKAIVELHSNELTRSILFSELQIIGHSVQIDENGNIVSIDAKNAYRTYFESIRPHIEALHKYFVSQTWIRGITTDELKEIQGLLERRLKTYTKGSEYIAADHPKFISSNLREHLKKIKSTIHADEVALRKAIDFVLLPEFEKFFNTAYYSCNLYDFKLTPKKSAIYDFKTTDGDMLEIVCKDAMHMSKNKYGLNSHWEPEFSIEYYIKKHLIEQATGKQFAQFIGAARDYLARDNFALRTDKNWNKKHPFVASSMKVVEFEEKTDNVRESYDIFIAALKKIQSRGMFVSTEEWKEEIHILGGKFFPVPASQTCSPDEYLNASNAWVKEKITDLVRTFSDNSHFQQAKKEELYIRSAIENILAFFYRDDSSNSTKTLSLPTYRDRATFHKTMATSLVFDFRDGAKNPMSESAAHYMEISENIKKLYDVIKNHPYHDFFEFDIDSLDADTLLGTAHLAEFFEWSKLLNLPVQYKCGFKLRKLGNYKANGIYFSHSRMLGLDFRTGRESFIHEIAHHIDLNKSFRSRREMVSTLYRYFYYRIDERREYYLKSEELIARAAEVSMLLKAAKYRTLSEYRTKPELMIIKMRENFSLSKESRFMRSWFEYKDSIHHIDIEAVLRSEKLELLDYIDSYFSAFWGWDSPSTAIVRETSRGSGHGDKSPYSESHHSMSYYMADIYKFEYPPFEQNVYVDLVLDFLTTTMPKPESTQRCSAAKQMNTLSYDPQENINTLKRLWGVYYKYKDSSYVRAALSKISILRLDEHSIGVVYADFKAKFGEHVEYEQMEQGLKELIATLRHFGYE